MARSQQYSGVPLAPERQAEQVKEDEGDDCRERYVDRPWSERVEERGVRGLAAEEQEVRPEDGIHDADDRRIPGGEEEDAARRASPGTEAEAEDEHDRRHHHQAVQAEEDEELWVGE